MNSRKEIRRNKRLGKLFSISVGICKDCKELPESLVLYCASPGFFVEEGLPISDLSEIEVEVVWVLDSEGEAESEKKSEVAAQPYFFRKASKSSG